ncbi:MAG: hypothetical protein V4628_11690 [Pseudomonadota bacterium]
MKATNVSAFISDLDGNQFEADLGKILSSVGAAVVDFDGEGQVNLTFKMKRIGASHQVNICHAIKYERPTSRGKSSETTKGSTAMYVQAEGLTFFPSTAGQGSLLNKSGNAEQGMPPKADR